jgi:hypothetical protein
MGRDSLKRYKIRVSQSDSAEQRASKNITGLLGFPTSSLSFDVLDVRAKEKQSLSVTLSLSVFFTALP